MAGLQPALGATRPPSPVDRAPSGSGKTRASRGPSIAREPAVAREPATAHVPAADSVLVLFSGGPTRRTRAAVMGGVHARSMGRLPGTGLFLVHLRAGADPVAAARALSRSPGVRRAEPNWLSFPDLTPNDPLLPDQWGLNNTGQSHPVWDPPPPNSAGRSGADGNVTQAWDVTQGTSDTVVAVIDTGVDLTHPDLSASLWVNPGEIAGNHVDDDDNGFTDDVNGWDFYSGDDSPQDLNGHGTHVAGIAAAQADNAEGGAGVCPGCRIMALRAGSPQGSLPQSDILQAISYAWRNGADVINMSFGNHIWSGFERSAIATAGANGVLVVASAGNDSSDNDYLGWLHGVSFGPAYPASFDLPNIISVAASTDKDFYGYETGCYQRTRSPRCLFTNWGRTSVDLAAPGVDIQSTWLGGGYQIEDGTSMSAPFVSGVAGLVKSLNASYSVAQIKNAILNSVGHPENIRGRYSVTAGRIDALAALTGSTAPATPVTDGTIAGAVPIAFTRSGTLSLPSDINDIYRRRLIKGRRYVVSLQVPKTKDFDLYVWKPGTLDTWQVTHQCGGISCQLRASGHKGKGLSEQVAFVARTTGVYYLHVTAVSAGGKYVLRVAVG
jgi:subtilisin family serine protease